MNPGNDGVPPHPTKQCPTKGCLLDNAHSCDHRFDELTEASNTGKEDKALMEELAAIEHKRWSSWHQFAYNNWNPVNITRWNKQAMTDYKDLSEPTKELDRVEVRRYLPIFQRKIASLQSEIESQKHCYKLLEEHRALIQADLETEKRINREIKSVVHCYEEIAEKATETAVKLEQKLSSVQKELDECLKAAAERVDEINTWDLWTSSTVKPDILKTAISQILKTK